MSHEVYYAEARFTSGAIMRIGVFSTRDLGHAACELELARWRATPNPDPHSDIKGCFIIPFIVDRDVEHLQEATK